MSRPDISLSAMEPFNVGRSAYRLIFDFGIMLSCFTSLPNKKVLDFGAGTGWISEFLARLGYEVYAIDVDKGMPASVKSRIMADKRLDSLNIQTVIGSGMELPFPDGFFSHICCFDTLHHMNDYPKTFNEMSRVLMPGGRAVFIEPGARHSRSKETIAFIETYKKDDPTWIERDVVLDEIAEISRESGFSNLILQPMLLPGLKTYTAGEWDKFRKGDRPLAQDYMNLFMDFNYSDHLSFYCEKPFESKVEKTSPANLPEKVLKPFFRKKIAVDLTPMLPGGENGGAKPMILALLKHLPLLMPDCEFILLTSSRSHDELTFLDCPNLSRLCVHRFEPEQTATSPAEAPARGRQNFFYRLYQRMKRFLPGWMTLRLKNLTYRIMDPANLFSPSPLSRLNADLLFCPFTAPFFHEPRIPTISIVYDLQFLNYPHFFAPDELFERAQNFQDTLRKADHLVTISNFVHSIVLEQPGVNPSRVTTVHIGHVQDFRKEENAESSKGFLQGFGLNLSRYLFYPANFWQHKNHAMLLTAFRLFLEAHPESDLKLVCTGALESRQAELVRAAQVMGIEDRVVFPGFLPSSEVGTLYQHALALIFPSLYEGFGIPLLEAFAAGIPVLCSNITSLPEVGGDAVLYFDPFKPVDIANAIAKIATDSSLRGELVEKGKQRLESFGGAERMAGKYADLLRSRLETPLEHTRFEFIGATGDGWLQEQASLIKPHSLEKASAEVKFSIPPWVPQPLQVKAHWEHGEIGRWEFPAGREHILSVNLPPESGCLSLSFAPGFVPAKLGIGEDSRLLSAQCIACKIETDGRAITLYPAEAGSVQ